MTGMLACAATLAILSGLVKLLGKGRRPGTLPLLPLLELLAGIGGLYVVVALSPGLLLGGGISALLVALVLASSTSRALQARARRRHRELTEESRLATYVQYFSKATEEDSGIPEPPIPPSTRSNHSPERDR